MTQNLEHIMYYTINLKKERRTDNPSNESQYLYNMQIIRAILLLHPKKIRNQENHKQDAKLMKNEEYVL